MAGENISIYALGLGAVSPDVPLGGTPAAGSVAATIITPQLSFGGSIPLNVTFSGLVSGYVGLYQVNANMPAILPQGPSSQLTLTDDGQVVTVPIALQ